MRWMFAVFLIGCEPAGNDVGTVPTDPDALPDLTGDYDAVLSDTVGCEGQAGAAWMSDGLTITGAPGSLTFTFADGSTLGGSVDAAFTFEATGTVVHEDDQQDVFVDGLAFIGDETWNLNGDVTVDLLDSTGEATACTLTGLLEAEQIP